MKILITGGVGFIGTNAAKYFAKRNNLITIIDNFSRSGVEKNAFFLKKNFPKIKIIKAEVGEINKYKDELLSTEVVIHLAGQTAVTTSIKNPFNDFNSNLFQSLILLEFIRKNNLKTIIIYSSTNKVYGNLNHLKKFSPIDENEKIDFISPYGCSKGAADFYFLDYARIFGLKTLVFRQSCIYGEHQLGIEDQGWVAHFSKQFLLKKPITIFGDGQQIRDLLYINDLIQAYDLAIKNIKKTAGQVFNIGGGKENAHSLLEVIEILENEYGYKIPMVFKKPRIGDQKYFVSKNEKIKKFLGWSPKTGFKKGLKKLINWQRKNLL